jgi:hypothetical protein
VTDAVDVNGMSSVVNNLSCGDCPADSDCDGNGGGGRRADVPNVNASAGVNSSMHDNDSEDADGSELHEGDVVSLLPYSPNKTDHLRPTLLFCCCPNSLEQASPLPPSTANPVLFQICR